MSTRLALITGGASGIGLACAEALVANGWNVSIADRDPRVGAVAAGLGGRGHVLDVRDTAAVEAWVNEHPDAFGLVTSAGICAGEYLVDSTDEMWNTIMDINLMGTVRALRAFARNRTAAGDGGVATLIASNNAFWPARSIAQYCASKAAIVMLGKVAASELGQTGVRVNIVAPGETETPMTAEALKEHPHDLAEIERRTPFGRVGQPGDIGNAVRALMSDDCSWITGQLVSVDGGISLRGESDLNPVHQEG
ncbi:SDR family NAD(P)-dependent oxidoreductase [Kribbella solani]|uniref:SDR family NAD(P)-dependent oxidoreductase n=1 Tax=Kribbella solani TaxID=236067 RepID=UPI0029BBD6E7|nr:SDR family oxidoreductase [Kribbella solani]MDX3006561.1 SDR family NAD(P)-dependent oxidoreductase [Kribbella solani]